jgi:hypothetical protein
MEYKTSDELEQIAERHADVAASTMSREQRLLRWAELLRADSERNLRTLHGTEYQTASVRDGMREDDSPISVAFADPVLRFQGMADDTYGEAKRFFDLTDRELHHILCHCHVGDTMSAGAAAARITTIATPPSGIIGQAWRALAG